MLESSLTKHFQVCLLVFELLNAGIFSGFVFGKSWAFFLLNFLNQFLWTVAQAVQSLQNVKQLIMNFFFQKSMPEKNSYKQCL